MNRKAPCLVPSQGKRDVVYVPPNNQKKFKIPYCHCSNTDCTVIAPDEHQALRAGWEFEMVGDEVKILCPLCKEYSDDVRHAYHQGQWDMATRIEAQQEEV